MYFQRNISDVNMDESENAILSVISNRNSSVLRDTLFLVKAEETNSKKINVGMSYIYPKCTTSGHGHEDMEEVYYIIAGTGNMVIGEEIFSVNPGDVFYIPFGGVFHKTENTSNTPMQYIWMTNTK